MTLHNPALPLVVKEDSKRLAHGVAVGLLAAGIGALYTVYARWGIARGLESPDLTALRFGVAGLVTLPILVMAWRKDRQVLIGRWKLWLAHRRAIEGSRIVLRARRRAAPPGHGAREHAPRAHKEP